MNRDQLRYHLPSLPFVATLASAPADHDEMMKDMPGMK